MATDSKTKITTSWDMFRTLNYKVSIIQQTESPVQKMALEVFTVYDNIGTIFFKDPKESEKLTGFVTCECHDFRMDGQILDKRINQWLKEHNVAFIDIHKTFQTKNKGKLITGEDFESIFNGLHKMAKYLVDSDNKNVSCVAEKAFEINNDSHSIYFYASHFNKKTFKTYIARFEHNINGTKLWQARNNMLNTVSEWLREVYGLELKNFIK